MTAIEQVLDGHAPPIPWLYEFAATVTDESRAEMYTDAGTVARSLTNAADLFDLAAVGVPFDTTAVAEAAGCSVEFDDGRPRVTDGTIASIDDAFDVPLDAIDEHGRLPTFLDATERLSDTLADVSVLGCVTGPGLLVDQLLAVDEPDDELLEEVRFTAGDLLTETANAYLSAGAEGVLVLDPDGPGSTSDYDDLVQPLGNVLDHYDGAGIVVSKDVTAADADAVAATAFDAITGRVDLDEGLAERSDVLVGVGVPQETFRDGKDAVAQFLDELPVGALVSSEWTVPADATPESVHEVMGSL